MQSSSLRRSFNFCSFLVAPYMYICLAEDFTALRISSFVEDVSMHLTLQAAILAVGRGEKAVIWEETIPGKTRLEVPGK